MPENRHPHWAWWLLLSLVVVVLDLATKAWITSAFRLYEVREITPFFNLVRVHNTGAAFSFLADAGGWQRWFFVVLAIAITAVLVAMLRKSGGNTLFALSAGLVIGGAVGNVYDRVTLGYVVDFIQLHAAGYAWPAFNVADSAITVGVVLLIWDSFRGPGREPATAGGGKT